MIEISKPDDLGNYWRICDPNHQYFQQYHRVYGPAIKYDCGTEFWYQFGQLHRMDGPAIIQNGNLDIWMIRGVGVTLKIKEWMKEFSINPDWQEWTTEEKVLLRLSF